MPEFCTFTGPNGSDPVADVYQMKVAMQTTTGDMLLVGQIMRSRIKQRTQQGIDLNGAAFAPYSTKGPYYLYPDGRVGRTHEQRAAQTARRHRAIGGKGQRTRLGIRYDGGYAEAKAAHGRSNPDLFGLEHHPHMMNGLVAKAGGVELDEAMGELIEMSASDELDAWSQNQPCSECRVGLYDEELAARAKGNDEGTAHIPQRKFLGANAEDLRVCQAAVGQRIFERMKAKR